MKTKKRIFVSLIVFVMLFVLWQVAVSAEGGLSRSASVDYTICDGLPAIDFKSNYSESFNCSQADTLFSLQSGNHAKTEAMSVPSGNTYKEAYVAIRNSGGTWKTDISYNSNLATVVASVNPIAFTPVFSQHELIFFETSGYKMHSRIYQ